MTFMTWTGLEMMRYETYPGPASAQELDQPDRLAQGWEHSV